MGKKLGVAVDNSVGDCVVTLLAVEDAVGELDGFIETLFNDGKNDGSDVGKFDVGLKVTLFDAAVLLASTFAFNNKNLIKRKLTIRSHKLPTIVIL